MLNELIQKDLIETGRKFTMGYRLDDLYNEDFVSDQDQKRPCARRRLPCPCPGSLNP